MNDNPDTNTSSDTNEPPKPKLMLDHTPGFVHEEHTDQGDIVLFRSTQPDFRLDFQADISWFTEGDPQTALSFYMEPSGNNYWQFTDPDQPSDLANPLRGTRTLAGRHRRGMRIPATPLPGIAGVGMLTRIPAAYRHRIRRMEEHMTGRRKRGKPYRGTSPFIEAYEKAKENQCRETNTASPQASKTGTYRNSGKAGSVTTCSRHCAG